MVRIYVSSYVVADAANSVGHPYHAQLLPPRVPIVLPHSGSFVNMSKVRPCLSDVTYIWTPLEMPPDCKVFSFKRRADGMLGLGQVVD